MSGVDYTCPGCGSWIGYNPDLGKFRCEYCLGEYTLEEVEAWAQKRAAEEADNAFAEADIRHDYIDEMVGYTCKNCGAQAMAQKGATATVCFYCHKPIVIAENLSGQFKPERIVPFGIGKEKAMETFLNWAEKKKFKPKGFTDKSRIEEMTGVYLPFWWGNFKAEVNAVIEGKSSTRHKEGNRYRIETEVFEVHRGGPVELKEFGEVVLSRYEDKFIFGLGEFDKSGEKDFAMPYLAGNFAESYDKSEEEIKMELTQKAYDKIYGQVTQIPGESAAVRSFDIKWTQIDWHYGLLPVWMLNYNFNDRIYKFGINGVSGQAFGEVPIDKLRLNLFSGGVGAIIFVLMLLGGAFLW